MASQGGSPVRYSFLPKPQLIVNQNGQLVQINQQPQLQPQNVQFCRPRIVTPARIRMSSPQNQQPGQIIKPSLRPRVASPPAQNPLLQVQHYTQQPGPQQQNNKIVCFVRTQPDGTRMIIPQSQYNQQGQQQTQQIGNQVQLQTQQPLSQQQPQPQVELALATSTFTPRKGDQMLSMDDYRKRNAQQMKPIGMVRPANQIANQIRAQAKNPALQVIRQRPAPRPQFNQMAGQVQESVSRVANLRIKRASQSKPNHDFKKRNLQQQASDGISLNTRQRVTQIRARTEKPLQENGIPGQAQHVEIAKMLVILDNGEQRLITFTLPKETGTVQELLDQVGIQVGADSNIECIENPGSEIDYIVKVGNFASRDTAAMTKAAENYIRQQKIRQKRAPIGRCFYSQNSLTIQQVTDGSSKKPKNTSEFVPVIYTICDECGCLCLETCERCNKTSSDTDSVTSVDFAH
jgi:hypothetical protein